MNSEENNTKIPRKREFDLVAEKLSDAENAQMMVYDIMQRVQLGTCLTREQEALFAEIRQFALDASLRVKKAESSLKELLKDAVDGNVDGSADDHPSKYNIGITNLNERLLVSISPKDPSELIGGRRSVVHFINRQDGPQLLEAIRRSQRIGEVIKVLENIAIEVEMTALERDIVEYWKQHPSKK